MIKIAATPNLGLQLFEKGAVVESTLVNTNFNILDTLGGQPEKSPYKMAILVGQGESAIQPPPMTTIFNNADMTIDNGKITINKDMTALVNMYGHGGFVAGSYSRMANILNVIVNTTNYTLFSAPEYKSLDPMDYRGSGQCVLQLKAGDIVTFTTIAYSKDSDSSYKATGGIEQVFLLQL